MFEHRKLSNGREFLQWRFDLSVEDRLVVDVRSHLSVRVMQSGELSKYEAGGPHKATVAEVPPGIHLMNHGCGTGAHVAVIEKLSVIRSARSSGGSLAGPPPGLARVEKRGIKLWSVEVQTGDELYIQNTAAVNARVMTREELRDYLSGEQFTYCGCLLQPGQWPMNLGGRAGELVVACDRIPLGPDDGTFRWDGGGDVSRDVRVLVHKSDGRCIGYKPWELAEITRFRS